MSENSIHQELASGAAVTDNYYKLFRIKPTSSEEVIKEVYHRLSKEFHPDRTSESTEKESTAIFTKLALAYTVLSDPIARALYDIKMGYKKDCPEEHRRINHLKRNQALQQIELYECAVAKSRTEEEEVQGLVILEALYGDISVDCDSSVHSKDFSAGKCIDVTVPLQCAIKSSHLFVHGGGSLAWLEGFYDPNDNRVENMLYIRYKFQDVLHEAVFDDNDSICLPLEEHLIPEEELEFNSQAETDDEDEDYRPMHKTKKPVSKIRNLRFKPRSQVQNELNTVKAARRRKLFTILGTGFITTALYYAQAWKIIDMTQWSPVRFVMSMIFDTDESTPRLTLEPQTVVALEPTA